MIYTRIKDKRLYPNTVVFQTTDGKGVTYYNKRVIEDIRAEIEALPRELPTDARNMVRRTRVLDIIDRHMKGADR